MYRPRHLRNRPTRRAPITAQRLAHIAHRWAPTAARLLLALVHFSRLFTGA